MESQEPAQLVEPTQLVEPLRLVEAAQLMQLQGGQGAQFVEHQGAQLVQLRAL